MDYLIRGGLVFDGSGKPPQRLDVAVDAGRIAAVGNLEGASADQVVDACGLAVMPGFIDVHTHSDYTIYVEPRARSAVHQGVTTHIAGNCGYSCAPLTDPTLAEHLTLGYEPSIGSAWSSLGSYFEVLERSGLAINLACLVGHGSVRAAAMGLEARPARADELEKMCAVLTEALDDGAIGMSTGLAYPPGTNAKADELYALCEVVARHGKLHASHVRNRDVDYQRGFGEVLGVTYQTGVPLQISHIATKYGAPRGATHHALEMVDDARRKGHDVACDMLVCAWGPGQLTSFLQPWAFDGGIEETLRRLVDPSVRPSLRQPNPSWRMVLDPDQYDRVILARARRTPELVGKSLAELTALFGKDFHETACEILLANGPDLYDVWILGRAFDADDMVAALTYPNCIPASDDVVAAPEGVLERAALTPGCYGWAPQLFSEFVRERAALTSAEAVRKLTSLPAERFGLDKRGRLTDGYYADVVVLDLDQVANNATLTDFACYPSGIEYVFVNGSPVVESGQHTGALPGRVLRK